MLFPLWSFIPSLLISSNVNKALKVYSPSPDESSEARERLNVVMITEISRGVKRAYFRPVTGKHGTRSLMLTNSLKWGT